MSDIDLVIKIDEAQKKMVDAIMELPPQVENDLISAIRHGKPLSKGHGRIADMDEAIKCIKEVEGEDATWAIALIDWACGKRTIIEADNAESEEA